MAPQFHETRMGHEFYESTLPRITTALETIVKTLTNKSSDPYLQNMRIHEEKVITDSPYRETKVLRVLGGWIYSFEIKEQKHFGHVFVPEP
jgi:hypothetical protein